MKIDLKSGVISGHTGRLILIRHCIALHRSKFCTGEILTREAGTNESLQSVSSLLPRRK